jgi:hypothetical protein
MDRASKINDFRGPGKKFALGPLGPVRRIARRATVRSMISQKAVKETNDASPCAAGKDYLIRTLSPNRLRQIET